MASSSPISRTTFLPGSRSRGSSGSAAHLWPNPVPLECGVVRLPEKLKAAKSGPSASGGQKFPINQLKKLLLYCKGKGKTCYPNIRFSSWLHIATNKLNLTEELAWIYFETFDVVSSISAESRLELLGVMSKCSSADELNELRKKLSVNTLQFVLFLYLQNAPRSSLKTPMVAAEEWPSPESELKQKSSEHYHLMFLKANLQAVLELLQDPEGFLTEEAVKALDFVLSSERNSAQSSLLDLAVSASSPSGYAKLSRSFSLSQFEFWVRSLLGVNPHGPYNLLSHRRELKPATCFRSDGSGHVLVNPTTPQDHRCAVLYRIHKQTLASCNEGLHHSNVYIRNCQRSNIYLLAPMRSVHVEKCSRCVLVLGATSSAVEVANCDSLTIIAASRRVHISSSSYCNLYLLTMTRPLLLPACLHVTFAPYNTHYPSLGQHLRATGLDTSTNCWDSPMDLTGPSTSDPTLTTGPTPSSPTWQLMPPELFRPIEVPFDLPGQTVEIPCPLPPPYLQAMAVKKERLKQWYDMVSTTHLTKEQSKQLGSIVKDNFDEWLGSEGHKKELLDLGLKVPAIPTFPTTHSHSRPVTTSTTPIGSNSPPTAGRHLLSQHN